jgi:hypothetical protein
MSKLGIAAVLLSIASLAHAQNSAGEDARRRAEEEHQRQVREQAQLPLRQSLDPSRIATVGLWPGPPVPCKLPKREQPYTCRRLLAGPALILSELPLGEAIVARGDAALAKGDRAWWLHYRMVLPLALAPGEVLYSVGEESPVTFEGDLVVTLYR